MGNGGGPDRVADAGGGRAGEGGEEERGGPERLRRSEEPEKRGYRQRAGEIACRIDQGGARLAREERVGAPGGPRRGHGERGEQGGGASRRHRQRDQPDQGEKKAGEGLQAGPLAADHARADHGELTRPEEAQGT